MVTMDVGLMRRINELERKVSMLEMELLRQTQLEELIKKFGLCHPDLQAARVDLPIQNQYTTDP